MNAIADREVIDYQTLRPGRPPTEGERLWAEHPRTVKTIALLKQATLEEYCDQRDAIITGMMVPEQLLEKKE
jgi:hypothetical protein